jgi:Zinc-uptake complex component A periplasmic
VVASTDVYGAIVSAVGGSAVQVTSIINSPDADPHEYESTPKDAVAVGKAKLLIYNGAGYDVAIQDPRGLVGSCLVGALVACRLDRRAGSVIMAGCPGRGRRLMRS